MSRDVLINLLGVQKQLDKVLSFDLTVVVVGIAHGISGLVFDKLLSASLVYLT